MIRRFGPAAALVFVTVLCFALAPTLSASTQNLGVTLLCYLTIAQAWNLLAGFSGQISLGAAAFVATGSYTTALLLAHTGLPWPLAVAGSGLVSMLLAALLAIPLLRLRGDYFAIGTLAISIALQALIGNWNWAGGASGLTLPVETIPSGGKLFQLAVIVAALALGAVLYVQRGAFGLRLAAIRDNEPAAAGLGVAVYRHRLAALLPSAALTGLAGAIIAFQFVVISPDGVASVNWSLDAVLMTVVGGMGTLLGPVVGVAIVYYGLTYELQDQQTLSQVIEGVLLIVIVRFAPQGVWPVICRAARRPLGVLRRSARPAAPEPAPEPT
ncbi:MAG TPA: branched-chain amino acid ABC transporter permease [Actinospica sp.]|jgi:branched-chain amino acid transport system permease protein|nr:branched-chain amino acid ABC transporter permease [Actinospica sp.]